MRPATLSGAGTELLVALCAYVYASGAVSMDAKWAARVLARTADEDLKTPPDLARRRAINVRLREARERLSKSARGVRP